MSNLKQFNDAALNIEEQNSTIGGRRRERLLNYYRPENNEGYLEPIRSFELQQLGRRSQNRLLKQYHRRVRRYYNA